MEDYVFILIAIALSVFSAVRQSKKRKTRTESNQPSVTDVFRVSDSIFGDFLNDDEDLFSEKTPVTHVVKTQPVKPKAQVRTIRVSNISNKSAGVPPMQQRQPAKAEEGNIKRIRHPAMDGFSLKKAVIYSEVLQRKY